MRRKITTIIIIMSMLLTTVMAYAAEYTIKTDLGTTFAIQDQVSYLGLLNHADLGDNGTRLYLLPKAEVQTGVGGALKLFADPFQDNKIDYRDLGLYFSADQKGDIGQWGDGVFWLNSKAVGKHYAKNPDIGFSFQDGSVVGGRFVYFQNNGNPQSTLVVGEGYSTIAPNSLGVKLEIHGDIGLRNNDLIRYVNSTGVANSGLKFNNTDYFTVVNKGQTIFQLKPTATNRAKLAGSIAGNQKTLTDNSASIIVGDSNSVVISNNTLTKVTSLGTSESGLEVTLIFTNGNTTLQNNNNVKLQGGVDFKATANDTIKLISTGSTWYEVSRSIN